MNTLIKYRMLVVVVASVVLLVSFGLYAQVGRNDRALQTISKSFSNNFNSLNTLARNLADSLLMPVRIRLESGEEAELMLFDRNLPLIYITGNITGAALIKTDRVYPGGSSGLSLTGQGQTLGIWDGGKVLNTHQELTGRVMQLDGAAALSDHATHVAGTLIASGVVAAAKGMSYQAQLNAFDWNNDSGEMAWAASQGLTVSQHSYGYITGWQFGNWGGSNRWHWFGNVSVSQTEDCYFGFYDYYSQLWDEIAFNAPNYLIVKSSGNDRGQGPAPGTEHYFWNGSSWQLSTTTRDLDGGAGGWDCIARNGNAKNILTVGATDNTGGIASFSSCGPADDGRVKPEVVAKGINIYSSGSASNSSYTYKSGTSMSGPMVSGSLGLLLQHQQNLHPGRLLLSSTLRALVIHTANDAVTPGPGPDYRYGWGLMDTEKAALLMSQNAANNRAHIREMTLYQGEEIIVPVKATGSTPLRLTLAWNDPPAESPEPALNSRQPMLVNDLDVRILDGPTPVFFPYCLNPNLPSQAAYTGDNVVDNVEVIHVDNPQAGKVYYVSLRHKNSLLYGMQPFSLIISGNDPFGYDYLYTASDKAANYQSWNTGNNQGYGFRPWVIYKGGNAQHYLGSLSNNETFFIVSAGGDGSEDICKAFRTFAVSLPAGAAFSTSLRYNDIAAGGEIGFRLHRENSIALTWRFLAGSSYWELNDGDTTLVSSISYDPGKTMNINFRRNETGTYSLTIIQAEDGYELSDQDLPGGTANIDRVEWYSSRQGSGNYLAFRDISVRPGFQAITPDATVIVKGAVELEDFLEVERLIIENGNQFIIKNQGRLTVGSDLINLAGNNGLIIEDEGSIMHQATDVPAKVRRAFQN